MKASVLNTWFLEGNITADIWNIERRIRELECRVVSHLLTIGSQLIDWCENIDLYDANAVYLPSDCSNKLSDAII